LGEIESLNGRIAEYDRRIEQIDLPPINRSRMNVKLGLEKGGQDGEAEAYRRADHQ
jgi:hypothetical protein